MQEHSSGSWPAHLTLLSGAEALPLNPQQSPHQAPPRVSALYLWQPTNDGLPSTLSGSAKSRRDEEWLSGPADSSICAYPVLGFPVCAFSILIVLGTIHTQFMDSKGEYLLTSGHTEKEGAQLLEHCFLLTHYSACLLP